MGTHVLARPRTILAAVALLSALTLLFSSVPLATAAASDDGLQRESDTVQSAETTFTTTTVQRDPCDQYGYTKLNQASGSQQIFHDGQLVGTLNWGGPSNTEDNQVTWVPASGWDSIEICIKAGNVANTFATLTVDSPSAMHNNPDISHIGWRNPEATPEPDCVAPIKANISHTFDGRTGTITIAEDLCDPLYVRATTWSYDEGATPTHTNGPAWPQTYFGSNSYTIQDAGYYPYVAPALDDCYQHDIYASTVQSDLNFPNNPPILTGPGQPYEPPFLHSKSTGPSPTWSFTTNYDCSEDEEVAAEAFVVTEADCENPEKVTIPETTGLEYLVDGVDRSGDTISGPGPVTVTAVALDGYVLVGESEFVFDLADAEDCPELVKPKQPKIVTSSKCGVPDKMFVYSTPGVVYKIDGVPVSGWISGPAQGTVVAEALDGYELTKPLSFDFDLKEAEPCPTWVKAVIPQIDRAQECGVPDTLTIPTTEGVQYRVNGQNVDDGTVISGPAIGLVTARAEDGFRLLNPLFVYPFLLKGAKDCPVEVEAPVATEADCDTPETLIVPTVENISYLLDGDDVSGQTITGPATGTIEVVADEGFKLVGESEFPFDLADADDCVQAEPALVTEADCDNPEVLSIPSTEGVVYLVDGVDASGTSIDGPGSVTVTAVAAEGFVLVDGEGAVITELVSTFDLADADDCPDVGDDDGDDIGDDDGDDAGDDDDGDVGAGDDNGDAGEGDDDGDEVTDDDGDDDGDETDVLPTPPVSPTPTPTQPPVAQAPAPPTPGTSLAATGGDLMLLLFAGLVALSLGMLSLMVGRRRTARSIRHRA